MKAKTVAWITAATTFVVFLLVALLLHLLLDLTTGERWVLWISFTVLGLGAAVILLYALLARAKRAGEPEAVDDEIDALFAHARRRLASSRVAAGAGIGKLPVVVLLGPTGGTKTTLIIRSGLEPELLAGEVHRGEAVTSTGSVNVWYAQNAVFVEAGGPLANDASRWQRLLRHVQPDRLRAVFSRGTQAPRVAVVCFPCDDLVKPGAGEAVVSAARRLRARLVEMSQRLGIRLPVYVMFTKADRLPYFADYLRNFTRGETQEVLGVTLPVGDGSGGSYAERESSRLSGAFSSMFKSLALRRLEVLPRESQEDTRSGAYEFPREFRKITDLATQFMVDLCRPSQLSVSPFLRGFYFTGVRPVVVSDMGVARSAPSSGGSVPVDATGVFDARMLQQAAQPSQPSGGQRRVPEWAFLRRVFGEVVLADRAAHAMTGGGTRLNLLRRGLMAVAALGLVVVLIGMTVSFGRNASLSSDVRSAAAGVETIDLAATGVPALEALQRLDSLGRELDRLRTYVEEGPPLSMRWFQFSGGRLLEQARRVYFNRFGRLLWTGARTELLAYLRALPAQPNETSEYDATYEALKAHLVTTSHPQESSAEFLAPVLLDYWSIGRAPDEERAALAREQFARFGRELAFGNPFADAPDEALIARTRAFLGEFGDADRFYQATLAEAASSGQTISFNAMVPQDLVVAPYVVPAAFTPAAWGRVEAGLNDLDRLFERESWVVGDQVVAAADRAELARELRSRYVAEYVRHWQQYLSSASIANFSNISDAAAKLARLSSNQSPLLQLLGIAARNTMVDSTSEIGRAFLPVRMVTPVDQTGLVGERTNPYMGALAALQSGLAQAASAPTGQPGATGGAASAAEQGRLAVRQLTAEFPIGAETAIAGGAVERLLLEPIAKAEAVIGALPAIAVNQRGAAFCQTFAPLLQKFPFQNGATTEASIDEIAAAFKPNASALSNLISSLGQLITPQGDGYAAVPGSEPRVRGPFLDALNRAVQAQRAFYPGAGEGPTIDFLIRAQTSPRVSRITIAIDGQISVYTPTEAGVRAFRWVGERANTASIVATVDGTERTIIEPTPGPWAAFRMLRQAEWQPAPQGWNLTWRVAGLPVTVTALLSLPAGVPQILEPTGLSRLSCVATIAS